MILCDFAEALNGKLYIMGGGWTRLTLAPRAPSEQPKATMALAVILQVPWVRTNERLRVRLRLVTEDGQPCLDADDLPVQVDAEVEIGRPLGIRQGIPQSVTFSIKASDVIVNAAGYSWILEVNEEEVDRTSFEAVGGVVTDDV